MTFTDRERGVDLPELRGDAYGEPIFDRDGETYGEPIREFDGETYGEPRREPDGDAYGEIRRDAERLEDDDGDRGNLMLMSLDSMDMSPLCVCSRSAIMVCLEINELTSEDLGRGLRGDVTLYLREPSSTGTGETVSIGWLVQKAGMRC